jgi:predicted PurR-regulated permease PerM
MITRKINPFMRYPFNSLPFYHKLASVLVSLIAIGYLVILAKDLLSPVIFSCLFSILLLPLAVFLEKKTRLPRGLASMLAVLILLVFISLIVYVVGAQIGSLADDWPQFKQQLAASLSDLQHWISRRYHITIHKQLNYVQSATSKVLESGTAIVGTTILSISSIVLFLIFTFIFTFFFLAYRRLIMTFLVDVFMEENASTVQEIVKNVQYILRKYILGLFIEMLIVATIVCIAFWALDVKYAVLLGLITGLFNIIPYIGIFTAMLLSALITFATAATAGKVVLVIVSLVITHLIDSNVLLPVIVGSKVKINPLVTVLGVVIGEMIWGISGMFLSIPVIAVMKIVFDRVESLKPWGLLLGEEEKQPKQKKAVPLPAESSGGTG